jgi:hypothetical protein
VVLEELVGQVAADGFVRRLVGLGAQALGEPGHVLVQRVGAPHGAQELAHAVGGVVLEPEFVGDRHDAVGVGREGLVAGRVEADVAGVGVDQAGFVEAVAAHHAADGVGDQFRHGVLAEAAPLLLFSEVAAVAVGGVHRESDLLDGTSEVSSSATVGFNEDEETGREVD